MECKMNRRLPGQGDCREVKGCVSNPNGTGTIGKVKDADQDSLTSANVNIKSIIRFYTGASPFFVQLKTHRQT